MLTWPITLERPPSVLIATSRVHGAPHPTVERHGLHDAWALHLYTYRAQFLVQGHLLEIRPRYVSVIPPGVPVEYRFEGLSRHLCIHFRLPAPVPGQQTVARVPALTPLGDAFADWYARLESAISATPVNGTPYFVTAYLWHLLCELAHRQAPPGKEYGSAVERAVRFIELNLSEVEGTGAVAEAAGVTPGHLTRLFKEAFGQTLVQYVRQQRVVRARHLLQNTSLPIKEVAALVGIPDPFYFNKIIRAACGCSPRALRQGTRATATEGEDDAERGANLTA
jgi:AraC-type DNA-binding domain-containing proteins